MSFNNQKRPSAQFIKKSNLNNTLQNEEAFANEKNLFLKQLKVNDANQLVHSEKMKFFVSEPFDENSRFKDSFEREFAKMSFKNKSVNEIKNKNVGTMEYLENENKMNTTNKQKNTKNNGIKNGFVSKEDKCIIDDAHLLLNLNNQDAFLEPYKSEKSVSESDTGDQVSDNNDNFINFKNLSSLQTYLDGLIKNVGCILTSYPGVISKEELAALNGYINNIKNILSRKRDFSIQKDKRAIHNETEYKRRYSINNSIKMLSHVVPNAKFKSKNMIISGAIAYIYELKYKNAELQNELNKYI